MYTIRITKNTTTTQVVQGDWTVIAKDSDGNPKYGYADKLEKAIHDEIDILSQTVEELDLTSVIKAINGIK